MSSFNPKLPHAKFPGVVVMRKFLSKSNRKCLTVAWLGGEKMIMSDDVYDKVEPEQTVNIRANMDGDFLKNVELVEDKPSRAAA